MASWNLVKIGSGNGLLPDGTISSPEPVMLCTVSNEPLRANFKFSSLSIYLWNIFSKMVDISFGPQWVNTNLCTAYSHHVSPYVYHVGCGYILLVIRRYKKTWYLFFDHHHRCFRVYLILHAGRPRFQGIGCYHMKLSCFILPLHDLLFFANAVWWSYNAICFLQNPHNRHLIACLWGRDLGCLLWHELWFIFCCMQYHVLGRVIVAPDCIGKSAL